MTTRPPACTTLRDADHTTMFAAVAAGRTIRAVAQQFRVRCLVVAEIVSALGEPAVSKRRRKNAAYYLSKQQDQHP
jgi:hypothetical protein